MNRQALLISVTFGLLWADAAIASGNGPPASNIPPTNQRGRIVPGNPPSTPGAGGANVPNGQQVGPNSAGPAGTPGPLATPGGAGTPGTAGNPRQQPQTPVGAATSTTSARPQSGPVPGYDTVPNQTPNNGRPLATPTTVGPVQPDNSGPSAPVNPSQATNTQRPLPPTYDENDNSPQAVPEAVPQTGPRRLNVQWPPPSDSNDSNKQAAPQVVPGRLQRPSPATVDINDNSAVPQRSQRPLSAASNPNEKSQQAVPEAVPQALPRPSPQLSQRQLPATPDENDNSKQPTAQSQPGYIATGAPMDSSQSSPGYGSVTHLNPSSGTLPSSASAQSQSSVFGPFIRTGQVMQGPNGNHFRVVRDANGNSVPGAQVIFDPNTNSVVDMVRARPPAAIQTTVKTIRSLPEKSAASEEKPAVNYTGLAGDTPNGVGEFFEGRTKSTVPQYSNPLAGALPPPKSRPGGQSANNQQASTPSRAIDHERDLIGRGVIRKGVDRNGLQTFIDRAGFRVRLDSSTGALTRLEDSPSFLSSSSSASTSTSTSTSTNSGAKPR